MSEARKRIEEARYFLDRMKKTLQSPSASSESNHFAFKCDLNAFISFARSVTCLPNTFSGKGMFVLENEYANRKGFMDWHKMQVVNLKNDELANFFARQRTISIHHKSVQPHGITSFTAIEHIPVTSIGFIVSIPVNATEEEAKEIIARATPPEPPPAPVIPTETRTEQSWFFDEMPGGMTPQNEVITICEKYIAGIERLLSDWEAYQMTIG